MQIHSLPCNEYNYMVRMCYLWANTYTHPLLHMFFQPYDLSLKISLMETIAPASPRVHQKKKKSPTEMK